MTNTEISLSIIDSSIESSQFEKIIKINTKIIAVDYEIHLKLKNLNIDHDLLENYLEKNERMKLYDFVVSKYDWYEKITSNDDFKIENINILSLMSSLEFHEYVLSSLVTLFSIKNVLKYYSPASIHTTKKIIKFLNLLDKKIEINTLESQNITKKGFLTDKIELKFNFFSKPIILYLSKRKYTLLKNLYENFLCNINNLWLNKKIKKDLVLLLEFNTSLYSELIQNISNSNMQVVVLNRRRSAIWNKDSIKILKSNNVKILNYENFFDSKTKQKFSKELENMNKNLKKLWESQELIDIFSIEGIIFWPLIKNRLKKLYEYRLDDYLKFIFQSKNFLDELNIKKIISLGESGETENIILQNIKSDVDTIVLQHSFLRYNEEVNNLQWRYEDQNMIGLKSKKIFLWGTNDLNFFLNKSGINKKKLFISGSPRHDNFLKINSSINKKIENILITLSPISERSGLGDTNLIIKYNTYLNKILELLKKFTHKPIIIKLHPGENPHNSILLNYLKKIPDIIIYQSKDTKQLIAASDILINISPELYDSSTVMLEGLILKKPVIQLILDDELEKITPLNSPIFQVSDIQGLNKIFTKLTNDHNYKDKIIGDISKNLNNYLSYQNKSGLRFLELIENDL